MRIIKILSLICFLTIGVWAQGEYKGNVKGIITDSKENALENVQIELVSNRIPTHKRETKTDNKGFFEIKYFPEGKATITALYIVNGKAKSIRRKIKVVIGDFTIVNLQVKDK